MTDWAMRNLCGSPGDSFTSIIPSAPLAPPLSWMISGCFIS